MAYTLESILKDVSSYVDQADDTPTGEDLAVRTRFVNRRLRRYGESYDWSELNTTYGVVTSQISTATITVPSTYKKLSSEVFVYSDSVSPHKYEEIDLGDQWGLDTTDKKFFIEGNESDGYYMRFPNPLASGASVVMGLQSFPSSLATLSDTTNIANPEYVIQGVIADVLEGRSDERFPQAKQEADRILATALERENTRRSLSATNEVKKRDTTYRIGRR